MILLLDNFDSFTYNLLDYLEVLGGEVRIVRNDISPEDIDWKKISGLVLSPGPETPEKAGFLLNYVAKAVDLRLPTLGVCLGHQAIGHYFGAVVKKAVKPMHGIECEVKHSGDILFEQIKTSFSVVRYHSLVVDELPEALIPLAYANETDEEKDLMAMKHSQLPLYGLQYHPESVLTESGHQVIENWMKIASLA